MQAILLDEEQSTVVSQSQEPIPVRDHAGNLLGRIVTGEAPSRSFDKNYWVERWTEWYLETEESELEVPVAR